MRWLTKLFPPRNAVSPPPAVDEWAAGDLAECLHPGPWFHIGCGGQVAGPLEGEVYLVAFTGIGPRPPWEEGGTRTYLAFGRFNMGLFPASMFRKVVPRADAFEAAEPEFIAQLPHLAEVAP